MAWRDPYTAAADVLSPRKKEKAKEAPKKESSPGSVTAYKMLPGKQLEEMKEGLRRATERITRHNVRQMGETAKRYSKRSGGKSR